MLQYLFDVGVYYLDEPVLVNIYWVLEGIICLEIYSTILVSKKFVVIISSVHSQSNISIQAVLKFRIVCHITEPFPLVISAIFIKTQIVLCQMIQSRPGYTFWIASVYTIEGLSTFYLNSTMNSLPLSGQYCPI